MALDECSVPRNHCPEVTRPAPMQPDPANREHVHDAIRRTQQGDVEAFAVVVDAYQRRLRSWLSRWCVPGIDADEISQRAFIVAYQKLAAFSHGTDFFAWLSAIARNVARDELKRLKRTHLRSRALAIEHAAACADVEHSNETEQIAALRDCMARLSQPVADLVQGYYQEHLSLDACALRFGKSVSAIKSQLHWVRGKLRECMLANLGRTQP